MGKNRMALSLEDVEKIAALARLELTAEEKVLYQEQLSAVLDYAERLNELELGDVLATSSALELQNVLRDDEVEPSIPTEDALFNASQHDADQFLIQAVFDES
jgi:aspartyl-tRNA(Asn)/glutamyl-tRNA(Gln) amidotransferase subunit C